MKNFFSKKVFSLKSYGTPGGPGSASPGWTVAFSKVVDNFAHLVLPLRFAKMCQLAKRFNCLLISMEQWRAGGNEKDRLRKRESNERSELSKSIIY